MRIEKLNQDTIEGVKSFVLGIIKNDFGYDFNPQWHWDISNLFETYVSNKRSCFYVAVEDGQVIGTIAARPYDKNYPEFLDSYNSENTLGIWRHYIQKDFRGKGIGTRLLVEVEKFAAENNYAKMYLHTQKTIPGSLDYWLAKGFEITLDMNDELQTVHLEKPVLGQGI